MNERKEEQKIQKIIEFIKDKDKKLLIYDSLFNTIILNLPYGYKIKDDGSIWIEGRISSDLKLIVQRK